VTDRRALEAEIHHSGRLARDDEEYALGVRCMAAPVVTSDLIGAVAVAQRPQRPSRRADADVTAAIQRSAARMQRTFGLANSA
jgi:DNA-binding IclR family transcriptional regulator